MGDVIGGVLCSERQKQTNGATKLSSKKQLKNVSSWWGVQLPTLIVGGVPGYRLGYP